MALQFTVDQFLGVFESCNQAIWPARAVAYLLGAAAVAMALWPTAWWHRAISAGLGLSWLLCTGSWWWRPDPPLTTSRVGHGISVRDSDDTGFQLGIGIMKEVHACAP